MALIAAAVAAEVSFSCPAEDVTFELVTGHVFRSPGDILGWPPSFLVNVFLTIYLQSDHAVSDFTPLFIYSLVIFY